MRSKFFMVGSGLGILALAVCGLPACSGSTTGGGGGTGGAAAGAGGSMAGAGGAMGGAGGAAGGAGGAMGGAGGAAGGAGGSAGASTMTCGTASCSGVPVPFLGELAPCCPPNTTDKCGLDVSQLVQKQACVEKNQPGDLNSQCPDNQIQGGGGVSITLQGCCKPDTNTCGYLMNNIASFNIGLGCVDPTSVGFTPDGGVKSCTPGGGGSGGTGGTGGAGGAGGAPADAGTG